MPRPQRCRRVGSLPGATVFKPAGVPARDLKFVVMTLDEFEALRLADYDGLYQEEAAELMGVSRPTFARILQSARGKIAQVLVEGVALRIEGGEVEMMRREFECMACGHVWDLPFGTGRPDRCPSCGDPRIHRRNPGGAHRGGAGFCWRRGQRASAGVAPATKPTSKTAPDVTPDSREQGKEQ